MVASAATAAVLMAATQSVAKVYVIGAVGFLAVKFPRSSPLLPSSSVGILARLSFNALVIPLVYSTTAISVSPHSLNEYWFVLLGAVVVMAISYVIPTILGLCLPIDDPHDYRALRIAATFPNVVALPILMFPSLCEYPFVYNMAAPTPGSSSSDDDLRQQCTATCNTIVFVFFFMWSLVFWGLGYPSLLSVARRGTNQRVAGGELVEIEIGPDTDTARESVTKATPDTTTPPSSTDMGDLNATDEAAVEPSEENRSRAAEVTDVDQTEAGTSEAVVVAVPMNSFNDLDAATDERTGVTDASGGSGGTSSTVAPSTRQALTVRDRVLSNRWVKGVIRTVTSPGFLALVAGFATGCIPPLKAALFSSGGALRFLGSALETLGLASNSISTMVVAASLVPPPPPPCRNNPSASTSSTPAELPSEVSVLQEEGGRPPASQSPTDSSPRPGGISENRDLTEPEDNPIMSDPTFGPYRRKQRRRSSLLVERTQSMVRRQSARLVESLPLRSSPEMRRLLIWFTLSRLVLAPAVVIGLIVTLDCATNVLSSVPALAKLVVIFNSSVPGAMIVVVLLKAQPHLSRTAAAISKVYLPTYLIAIFTMAGWTTLGLLVTIPASSDDPTPMICPSKW